MRALTDSKPFVSAMFGLNPSYNGSNDKYIRLGDYIINDLIKPLPTITTDDKIAPANR